MQKSYSGYIFMKKILRQLVAFIVVGPFILCIKILSFFSSREKAIEIMSPIIVKVAKIFVRILVPNVKNATDFDILKDTITKRASRLWPFYDISIAENNDNLLKLHVANCPFAELAIRLGYIDIGPFVCQGDWEVAKDNINKWDFERKHQIGTGDSYCDHTYKRKTLKTIKERTTSHCT